MMKRMFKTLCVGVTLAAGLAAAPSADAKTIVTQAEGLAVAPSADAKTIRVGVTPGIHEQVAEFVKPLVEKQGLQVKLITFSDYVLPNQALADGDIDINIFQHKPYLDTQVKDRGFKLISAGTNFIAPMGFYSQKIKAMTDLKSGDKIAIPNDPSNGGRALLLLQKFGVLKVKTASGVIPSVIDIQDNPKGVKIVELDAAQLPRSLPDVTVAAINTNYAVSAGLNPAKDSIARGGADSPYANIFAIRAADANAPWVKTFVSTYQSEPVRKFILETGKGAILPAF